MLRIALPNKGRLSEEALSLFERAGLEPEFRADRALVASLGEDFQAIFVRAADIPEFVSDGAAELGVTGADLVAESGRDVTELMDLGFGRCRLVVAVRDESSIASPEDVPDGTRIATSFPGLTRRFFEDLGISVEIAPVSGAAEIAPHLGVADLIVDLSSTGSTLRVNGLRPVGTILESSARMVANPKALDDDQGSGRRIQELVVALESVLRAERKRYLMANVPRDRLDEVREVLPGISGPTIIEVKNGGTWVAAHAVVDASNIYQTINDLKRLGAEGILVTRIERLMP
ncbi:MAG: ATP phosphoribosyltransferase [Gemmatimonadota bacterium]